MGNQNGTCKRARLCGREEGSADAFNPNNEADAADIPDLFGWNHWGGSEATKLAELAPVPDQTSNQPLKNIPAPHLLGHRLCTLQVKSERQRLLLATQFACGICGHVCRSAVMVENGHKNILIQICFKNCLV